MELFLKTIAGLFALCFSVCSFVLGLQLTSRDLRRSPWLLRVAKHRVRLAVLGLASAVLAAGTYAAAEIVQSASKDSRLRFVTTRIENINFIYSTTRWPFRVDPLGEDVMNPLNPESKRSGLNHLFPFQSDFPRIPEEYMYVDFTVENHADFLALVEEMTVEVVARHPMPEEALYNTYLPVLDPEEGRVVITGGQTTFPVFADKAYKYAPNEVDQFRLKVELEKDAPPGITEFRIRIRYRSRDEKQTITSDRHYFLASHPGPTPQQHDAAAREMVDIVMTMGIPVPSFDNCVTMIESGRSRDAEQCVSQRINRQMRFRGIRQTMTVSDCQPGLADNLFLRHLLRIQLGNLAGARADISYMADSMRIAEAQEFRDAFDGTVSKVRRASDGGRKLVTDFARGAQEFTRQKCGARRSQQNGNQEER